MSVEDMAISAASLKGGRPPRDRLALPLSSITQSKADVSCFPIALMLCCAGLGYLARGVSIRKLCNPVRCCVVLFSAAWRWCIDNEAV